MLDIQNEIAMAQSQVQKMQAEIKFEAIPPSKKAMFLLLLERIPLVAGFLHSLDATGLALSNLAYLKGNSKVAKRIGQGFQLGGILIAGIDFIRIPVIYLASWILGHKKPFSLTKTARWLYSGLLVLLLTTALLFPVTAAYIGLVIGAFALSISIITLGKYFYNQYQTKKELQQIDKTIEEAEKELKRELQREAEILCEVGKRIDPDDKKAVARYLKEVNDLKTRFDEKTQEIQQLYNRRYLLTQKLSRSGWVRIMDKGVAIGIGSLALMGMLIGLFFPPVGLTIALCAAVTGGSYIIARVGIAIFSKVIKNKMQKAASPVESENKAVTTHESTGDVMKELFGNKAEMALYAQIQDNQWIEQTKKGFASAVSQGNVDKVLAVFQDIAHFVKEHQASQEVILGFLQSFEKSHTVLAQFNQLLIENNSLHQSIAEISDYPPLKEALMEAGVTHLAQAHSSEEPVSVWEDYLMDEELDISKH